MTWKIYFIERTRAQICHSIHTTTDEHVAGVIVGVGNSQGFEVRVETEE